MNKTRLILFLTLICLVCMAMIVLVSCNTTETEQQPTLTYEWQITVDATCTTAGIKERINPETNQKESQEIIPLGHVYGEYVTICEPSCIEEGSKGKTCIRCRDVVTESIPKIQHSPSDWFVEKQPTCTESGRKIIQCTICKKELASENIKGEHTFGDWVTVEQPSCSSLGKQIKQCTVCKTELEEATLTFLNHSYDTYNLCVYCGCNNLRYDSSGSRVTGFYSTNTKPTTIVIPQYNNGVLVQAIDDSAFMSCLSLISVTIPESVMFIGDMAFVSCNNLSNITIPDNLNTIGDSAFSGCSSLTSLTIPASVTSIGDSAFSSCGGLTSINVSSGNVKYYSQDNCLIERQTKKLIRGCNNSVIPLDIITIGDVAFSGCSSLTNLKIPDSVTIIGDWAFSNCSSLTNLTISDNVIKIGNEAFSGCGGLTSINVSSGNVKYYSQGNCLIERQTKKLVRGCNDSVIPSEITVIGSRAFDYCTEITNFIIPNGVKSIEAYAFVACNLKNLTISDSVTSIDDWAFWGVKGIESINVSSGNVKYYSQGNCLIERQTKKLIRGCDNSVIPSDIITIGIEAFSGCSGLTSLTIPDSVTTIGFWAFSNCSGLTDLTIPANVTKISIGAFVGCSGLTSINVSNGNTAYYSEGDCLIERSTKMLILGCNNSVIPTDIESIDQYAFWDCSGFTGEIDLEGIKIIGYWAFYGCDGITSIVFSNSITSIETGAFGECDNITSVYYKGTQNDWENIKIYEDNTNLINATRYYYSETEPELNTDGTAYDGNYWHYNDNGEIVVWTKQ